MANTTRFPGSVPPPPSGGGGGSGSGGGPSKKSTSVRKLSTAAAPPSTRRGLGAAGSRSRDREEDGRERYAQPPPEPSKTNLYIGIGVGALVLVIIIAVMASGGDGGTNSPGGTGWVTRTLGKAVEARDAGQYSKALQFCEQIMSDPGSRKSSRYREVENLAASLRDIVNAEPIAATRLAEFNAKLEKAKADGTAMKRANELLAEAKSLAAQYRMTRSGDAFVGLRDGIQRWANTEASSDWLKDYNPNKARIDKDYISTGNFAGAVKQWNQFREVSTASDLKSRIDSEIVGIDIISSTAAQKVVEEAGTGADARAKIEEAQPRFLGTGGQGILKKALGSLK
jgi:hypothetical protein